MLGRVAYLALAAVLLALWALMTQVSVPEISAAAGGRALFDFQMTGYDLSYAQAFVDRLNPDGRDLYLQGQHLLDTVFPVLLAVFLAWSFGVLLPRWPALALALVAIGGAVADLVENTRVAGMLTAPELTEPMVQAASDATRIKWALDGVALSAFVVLVLVAGYRRFRPLKAQP